MARGGVQRGRRSDQPTKREIERETELAKVRRSAEVWTIVAYGIVVALSIAACALPLLALQSVVEPLAGKTTKVEANIVVSVSLAFSIGINGLQWVKGRGQRSEIKRLRHRERELENRIRGVDK
jgi:hypothetical protein